MISITWEMAMPGSIFAQFSYDRSHAARAKAMDSEMSNRAMCLECGLTPELSRTALRPWASETCKNLHEAAKRARLERIVSRHCACGRCRQIQCISCHVTWRSEPPPCAFPLVPANGWMGGYVYPRFQPLSRRSCSRKRARWLP